MGAIGFKLIGKPIMFFHRNIPFLFALISLTNEIGSL
jgi:hypothetical protein